MMIMITLVVDFNPFVSAVIVISDNALFKYLNAKKESRPYLEDKMCQCPFVQNV